MESKKILFVTTHFAPDYHYGGVVESSTKLLQNLRKISSVPIRLICVSKNPVLLDKYNCICKSNFLHDWGFSISLIYYLAKEIYKSDIIFINGIVTFPTTIAALYSIIFNKPFIVSIRGGLEPWRRNHKKWKKFFYFKFIVYPLLRKANKIHTTSEEEKKSLFDLRFRNIFVVSNGINLEDYDLVKSDKSENKVFKILFLSRTDKEKGIDILLEAYEMFIHKYGTESSKLYLVGPDNNKYLAKQHIDFNKRNIIYSTGIYNHEKLKLMKTADVFVLPSYSENFGNVIAESLVCETPVITTTGTPWREIEKIGCGIYIEPAVIPLFQSFEKIFNMDKNKVSEMGKLGREYIINNFIWEIKAHQILEKINAT